MRIRYNEQLKTMYALMTEMGALCQDAIGVSVKTLEGEEATARQLEEHVYAVDSDIDEMEREIESLCTKLLLQQQPVATDLRRITAALKMITDLERIGDHAENFYEIVAEMSSKKITFSQKGQEDLKKMCGKVLQMLTIAKDAFDNLNINRLPELAILEEETDTMKKELTASHFARLAEGDCNMSVSPYYSSAVAGLERVADHLVNVGYSIVNPIGSQK